MSVNYDPGYPPEYDQDPIADTETYLREVKWALQNWDTPVGPWRHHIDGLIAHCEGLLEYISEMT